ncbi:MAG: hypothetical protein KBD04_02765 [Proteobacteria bacterium]|nr:hypothetical protein [Pseudomonadota bacterium]
MLKYVIKMLFVILSLHFVIGTLEAASILDSPPDPLAFPDCPQADIRSFTKFIATVDNWFSTQDPTGNFKHQVFPNGLPKTRDSYNAAHTNPKNVYASWYNSRHAVSAASAQQIEEERKKREEAEQRVIQEELAKRAAEQHNSLLQQQLTTTKKEKETFEQKASAAEQQLTVVGQKAEIAQLDALVSKNIPKAVASEVLTLLNLPEHKTHQFLFDDTTYTVHLNVELKDGTVTEKLFGFSPDQYFVVVEGFKALAQQYQLMQTVFGDSQRPKYKIILTQRPPKQEGEPPALSTLMDSYYHLIENANQIPDNYKQMEEDTRELMQVMAQLQKCSNETEAVALIETPQCQQVLKRASVDVTKLISTFERQKNGFSDTFLGFLEDFFARLAEARDFSIDVNGLLLKTIQNFDVCMNNVKSVLVGSSPTYFNPYIKALAADRKQVQRWIEEEQERLISSIRADTEVQMAVESMVTQAASLQQELATEIRAMQSLGTGSEREKNIARKLSSKLKKKIKELPIFYDFISDPFWFFVILNDGKQFMKEFFAGKSNATDNDSKFVLFSRDLGKLDLSQKKALFINVVDLVENFENFEKQYAAMSYDTNKIKLQHVKDFLDSLRKVIKSESAQPSASVVKKSAYNTVEPLIRTLELIGHDLTISADLDRSLPQKFRMNKLVSLLDRNNRYVGILRDISDKSLLDGALNSPDDEQILKNCWDYIQEQIPVENIITVKTPEQVDAQIKELSKGRDLLSSVPNQDKISQHLAGLLSVSPVATSSSVGTPFPARKPGTPSSASASSSPVTPGGARRLSAASVTPGGLGIAGMGAPLPSEKAKKLLSDLEFIKEKITEYALAKGYSDPTTVPHLSQYYIDLSSRTVEEKLRTIADSDTTNAQDIATVRSKDKIIKPIRELLENPQAFATRLLNEEIPKVEKDLNVYASDSQYATYQAALGQAKESLTNLLANGGVTLDHVEEIIGPAYQKIKGAKEWSGIQ